jgi:hypothetical protein
MPDHVRSESRPEIAPDALPLDTSPIQGAVHAVPPITVEVASHSPVERLWDQLVRGYHYLGSLLSKLARVEC